MEIETGFQPNCSTLVAHLGPRTWFEIRDALELISEALKPHGWKLCVVASKKFCGEDNKSLVLPIVNFNRLHREESNANGPGVDKLEYDIFFEPHEVIADHNPRLSKEESEGMEEFINKNQKYPTWRHSRISIYRTDSELPHWVEGWLSEGLGISIGDGYCDDDSLSVQPAQHCTVQHYPVFRLVSRLFSSVVHAHDGGNTGEYNSWLAYWHEGGDDDDWDSFAENPPLNPADISRVRQALRELEDDEA